MTRMALKMPEPKNWQDLQRGCVILFSDELNDPHVVPYGRDGQSQCGIDVLARRDGCANHFVGIQCRRIAKPLTKNKILEDCRAALTIEAGLKEIVFATTAPDDRRATDDAIAVEKQLREEGYELIVAYYGWETMQIRIACHPRATAFFHPAAYANSIPQSVTQSAVDTEHSAKLDQILAIVQRTSVLVPAGELDKVDRSAEDPALHARIDLLRDLFQKEHHIALAERQLLELLATTSATERPWARFRIETNLGSIAVELGRETDAIERFEAAYVLRPNESQAIANLALARTIQGAYDEAFTLANQALATEPRAEAAVAYLLQAAARCDWEGDPGTLIPNDLKTSISAAFGMAEFLRRREWPDWPERTLALAKLHPDSDELRRCSALAVLELAVRHQAILGCGFGPISIEQINRAAEDMKILAERYLSNGYSHNHDLLAYVSNGAVLLRLTGRDADAEALLIAGLARVKGEPMQYRVLALSQAAQGRRSDAIKTLSQCDDVESAMLRVEMLSLDDAARALELAHDIIIPDGDRHLAMLRWRMLGDIALKLGRFDIVSEAVNGLRLAMDDPLTADLLEVRAQLASDPAETPISEPVVVDVEGEDSKDAKESLALPLKKLRGLFDRVTDNTDTLTRFELAETLMRNNCADLTVRLLENHVDLTRPTLAGEMYLQALAAARHDQEFERALARAAPELREDPDILWTRAARGWNMGDLAGALIAIDQLIAKQPSNPGAQLLKIDILARSDRTTDLLIEIEKPLETLNWPKFEDRAKLASYLAIFGQVDRAIALAYKLYLGNRDVPRAWLTLSGIVLDQGRSLEDRRWEMLAVASDSAVDLAFDDGEKAFLVVEPDSSLRQIDQDALPPEHPLVQHLIGLTAGDNFEDSNGRTGKIVGIRHKYVARFHYVLDNFERRFPDLAGFKRIVIDPNSDDVVTPILAQAKARHDWIEQETQQYLNGTWPLGLFAYRVGSDIIEAAAGLVAGGHKLKVSSGSHADVLAAVEALKANGRRGCTLDLLTYWTAWRLGALNALAATYGPVHVTQGVLDRLRQRRDRFDSQARDGFKTAHYDDGRLVITEVRAEALAQIRVETNDAIGWLEQNAVVSPVIATNDLPDIFREDLRRQKSDLFDAVVVSLQTNTIFICDDYFTRTIMQAASGHAGAWLQIALAGVADMNPGEADKYVGWFADLVDAGQTYLGVDGNVLARAAALDAKNGRAPGPLFHTLSGLVGGQIAEPRSHLTAVFSFLQIVWNDPEAQRYRQPASGLLFEKLIRERYHDYRHLLRALVISSRNAPGILEYLQGWLRGHFILAEWLFPEAAKRHRKRERAQRSRN